VTKAPKPARVAFPKEARVRVSRDYRAALDEGTKTVCHRLVLFGRRRTAESPLRRDAVRLGLVVSRKVGNSVVRNRVKRHLREAFRHFRAELEEVPALAGLDVVALARANAADADSDTLTNDLRHCLKRLARAVASSDGAPRPSPS
jgi:ribonuclease P protein component